MEKNVFKLVENDMVGLKMKNEWDSPFGI